MSARPPSRGPAPAGPETAARPADAPGSDPVLEALWGRHRQTSMDRIAALERAAAAARTERLGGGLQDEAARAAHALSGVLGTFGFAGATSLALEAEALLGDDAVDGARLASVAERIRREIAGPPA